MVLLGKEIDMNLSRPRNIPYVEVENLFERLDKTVEDNMKEQNVRYPDSYKAGYYASMVRMLAWDNPEVYAYLQDFVANREAEQQAVAA
jgi:hypothetical protein